MENNTKVDEVLSIVERISANSNQNKKKNFKKKMLNKKNKVSLKNAIPHMKRIKTKRNE